MNFDEYQKETLRTGSRLNLDKWLANAALGLTGEAGEAADLIKKHLFHGHDLNREKLKKELGDVLWYVAWLAEAVNIPLSEVAEANVAKLRERYPYGFDEKRSRDRGDGLLGGDQAEDITAKIANQPKQPVEPHKPPIATIDDGPSCSLAECPPGLFRVGVRLGFKSEYGADAYVLESGEFWWGGCKTSWERAEQMVQPLVIAGYKEPTVIIPSERLELEERMREHMKSHRVVVKGGT